MQFQLLLHYGSENSRAGESGENLRSPFAVRMQLNHLFSAVLKRLAAVCERKCVSGG